MCIKHKYLLGGIVFGFLFPITSILMDCCIFNEGSFSFFELKAYFVNNPVHYLVSTAPLFLGISFYIAGIHAQKQHQTVRSLKRINESLLTTNEALDSFNYHVSHDLKTVLSNTESLTIMLKKYAKKENYQKVEEITNRLLKISIKGQETVKSFLSLSKATSLVFDENDTEVNLKNKMEEIKNIYFKDALINLNIIETDFKTLKINEKAIESLMTNLLSNSIKYNDNKITDVTIVFKNLKGFRYIIYTDNGIGIDVEANKNKLFKPFERIENSKDVEGTGVGLYLVKNILSAYGGYVDIESKEGNGTTFMLAFPRR